jgi:hypothetical protein
MKPEKIFLLLSLIGIFILLILSNFNAPIVEGKVSKIKTSEHTTIYLENINESVMALNINLNLTTSDIIKVYGTKQENTIFATKISRKKC